HLVAQNIEKIEERAKHLVVIGRLLLELGYIERGVTLLCKNLEHEPILWYSILDLLVERVERQDIQLDREMFLRTLLVEAERQKATEALWKLVLKAAKLGYTELAVAYAQRTPVERLENLPSLLEVLSKQGYKAGVHALLPLCASDAALVQAAAKALMQLYPERRTQIAQALLV
ncbi:MAG: hypothetical protein RMJ66_08840, partial [Bacteroidia bacterium]|nr:hypothetical protein [Bacteroidia bacterium]